MDLKRILFELGMTLIYAVVGMVIFGISILVMEKAMPFSLRKEIEEDQNTALAIVIGASLIGIAIIIASVITSG